MKAILAQIGMPLRQAWQARPMNERRRLMLGLGVILILGGYLLVDHWPTHSEPQAAASSSMIDQALKRLPPQPQLTQKDWQTAASRNGIVIQTIQQAHGWQLSGFLSQPQDFQQLSRWAAQQGAWPYTYQLTRETDGWQWQAHFVSTQDWISLENPLANPQTSERESQ